MAMLLSVEAKWQNKVIMSVKKQGLGDPLCYCAISILSGVC